HEHRVAELVQAQRIVRLHVEARQRLQHLQPGDARRRRQQRLVVDGDGVAHLVGADGDVRLGHARAADDDLVEGRGLWLGQRGKGEDMADGQAEDKTTARGGRGNGLLHDRFSLGVPARCGRSAYDGNDSRSASQSQSTPMTAIPDGDLPRGNDTECCRPTATEGSNTPLPVGVRRAPAGYCRPRRRRRSTWARVSARSAGSGGGQVLAWTQAASPAHVARVSEAHPGSPLPAGEGAGERVGDRHGNRSRRIQNIAGGRLPSPRSALSFAPGATRVRQGRSTTRTMTPATRPQNAAPTPSSDRPEAVTRKVTSAASRSPGSCSAVARLLPRVPISAMPAIASTSACGNAANSPATVAPNTPTSR